MLRGEVAAVIGVEHIGNLTNMPVRIVLAPDRLAQSKRRLCGRRRLEKQEIATNSTAVVIQNYRKPWLSRIFTFPLHQDIKEGCDALAISHWVALPPGGELNRKRRCSLLSFMRQFRRRSRCDVLPRIIGRAGATSGFRGCSAASDISTLT